MLYFYFILNADEPFSKTAGKLIDTFFSEKNGEKIENNLPFSTSYIYIFPYPQQPSLLAEAMELLNSLNADIDLDAHFSLSMSQIFSSEWPLDETYFSIPESLFLTSKTPFRSTSTYLANAFLHGDIPLETLRSQLRVEELSPIQKEIISCLLLFNGHVIATSQYLFMHRNTINYQLQQIMQITGTDPRRIDDSFLWQLIYQGN